MSASEQLDLNVPEISECSCFDDMDSNNHHDNGREIEPEMNQNDESWQRWRTRKEVDYGEPRYFDTEDEEPDPLRDVIEQAPNTNAYLFECPSNLSSHHSSFHSEDDWAVHTTRHSHHRDDAVIEGSAQNTSNSQGFIKSKLHQYEDEIFLSMQELEKFVRGLAVSEGFNFVKGTSHYKKDRNSKEYHDLQLRCHLHNESKEINDLGKSAKCGQNCLFFIKAVYNSDSDSYSFVVKNEHNHKPIFDYEILAAAERLPRTVKDKAIHHYTNGSTFAESYSLLRSEFPHLRIAKSSVMNHIHEYNRSWLEGHTAGTKLLHYMTDKGFLVSYELKEDDDEVQKLLFMSQHQKEMLASYGRVLVLDCTYKTNRYNLPLLHIVGRSPLGKTYQACFAFINDETELSYVWALERLKEYYPPDSGPEVLVTDAEQSLGNAIKRVFPRAKHLLCTWHIYRCVHRKLKSLGYSPELHKSLFEAWKKCMHALTVSDFNQLFKDVEDKHPNCSEFVNYLTETWLSVKKKFIPAYTHRYECYGIRTTSISEAAHGFIKDHIRNRFRELRFTFDAIAQFCKKEMEKFRHDVYVDSCKRLDIGKEKLFQKLNGEISSKCLNLLKKEYTLARFRMLRSSANVPPTMDMARDSNSGATPCNCLVKIDNGIPCSHIIEIRMKTGRVKPYEVEEFPTQWRLPFKSPSFSKPFEVSQPMTKESIVNSLKKSVEELLYYDLPILFQIAAKIHNICRNPRVAGKITYVTKHQGRPTRLGQPFGSNWMGQTRRNDKKRSRTSEE